MKSFKKLIPAVVLLLVSTMLMATASYAWFSMNTRVTATGMQVKAKAEGGIVISNESKSEWKASATASHNTVAELIPTSTSNVTGWYHAVSSDANSAAVNQDSNKYESIIPADAEVGSGAVASDGIFTAVLAGETEAKNIYLLNKFYIQSSADQLDLSEKNPSTLLINQVTVSGTGTSTSLDASLRIAIKIGGEVYIYAPVTNATVHYTVAGTTAVTCKTTDKNVATTVSSIPAYKADGSTALEALIFIYFEGEDVNCKSANITATLDTLQVTVEFGTTTIA